MKTITPISENLEYSKYNNYKQNLELCKQFYDEFNRLPKRNEKYNGWNIGNFVDRIKNSNNNNKINDLKQIFKEHWIDGNSNDLKQIFEEHWNDNDIKDNEYEQKLELCKQFYDEFNRLPKDKEQYNGFNIGKFISTIKSSKNKDKINDLKQIFKEHWIDGNINDYSYKQKLKLCQEFYNEFHRLPKRNEKYKDFNIGIFINTIKRTNNENKLNDLEEIFYCKFN